MEGAREEQKPRTQEQIVDVEVISRIDEGWPREHLHAALPIRRERLERRLACDPGVRRSRARSHRPRAVVRAARPRRALRQLPRHSR